MADNLSSAEAADLARDRVIVRVRFTRAGKEYHYALTGQDIARYGRPNIGQHIHVPGTSCDPEVIGYGRNGYTGVCKVAQLNPPPSVPDEIRGLAALVDSSGTLHGINPDTPNIWAVEHVRSQFLTPNQENTTMKQSYKCPRGLLADPTPDNDELIAQHQEAIEAIKARKREAKRAVKAERKRIAEQKAAAAERARQQQVVRDTLEAIAADPKTTKANRIAAAVALGNLVG